MNQFNKETLIKAFRLHFQFGVHTISTAGNIKKALGGISQKEFNELKKLGLIEQFPYNSPSRYGLPKEWQDEVSQQLYKERFESGEYIIVSPKNK